MVLTLRLGPSNKYIVPTQVMLFICFPAHGLIGIGVVRVSMKRISVERIDLERVEDDTFEEGRTGVE